MVEIIRGNVPAKANNYKISRGRMYKDSSVKEYELMFKVQCRKYRYKKISKPFKLTIDVHFSNPKSDLDNALKTVLDCLQFSEAITNDNLCFQINAKKFIDKKNPRIAYCIEVIE